MSRKSIGRALAVVLLILPGSVVLAQEAKPIETFTAFAASLGTGRTGRIDITVNRWSTDEEREKLRTTLIELGPDKLLDELTKIRPPVGYMKRSGSLAWDLYYARTNSTPDGGRHVVLATNRRVAFNEVVNSTRSMQYQFTLIEIRLDKDGRGEGKMVPAAKVTWNADLKKIEIENYSALPVDLLQVVAKKP
jgi:hypothetical protein